MSFFGGLGTQSYGNESARGGDKDTDNESGAVSGLTEFEQGLGLEARQTEAQLSTEERHIYDSVLAAAKLVQAPFESYENEAAKLGEILLTSEHGPLEITQVLHNLRQCSEKVREFVINDLLKIMEQNTKYTSPERGMQIRFGNCHNPKSPTGVTYPYVPSTANSQQPSQQHDGPSSLAQADLLMTALLTEYRQLVDDMQKAPEDTADPNAFQAKEVYVRNLLTGRFKLPDGDVTRGKVYHHPTTGQYRVHDNLKPVKPSSDMEAGSSPLPGRDASPAKADKLFESVLRAVKGMVMTVTAVGPTDSARIPTAAKANKKYPIYTWIAGLMNSGEKKDSCWFSMASRTCQKFALHTISPMLPHLANALREYYFETVKHLGYLQECFDSQLRRPQQVGLLKDTINWIIVMFVAWAHNGCATNTSGKIGRGEKGELLHLPKLFKPAKVQYDPFNMLGVPGLLLVPSIDVIQSILQLLESDPEFAKSETLTELQGIMQTKYWEDKPAATDNSGSCQTYEELLELLGFSYLVNVAEYCLPFLNNHLVFTADEAFTTSTEPGGKHYTEGFCNDSNGHQGRLLREGANHYTSIVDKYAQQQDTANRGHGLLRGDRKPQTPRILQLGLQWGGGMGQDTETSPNALATHLPQIERGTHIGKGWVPDHVCHQGKTELNGYVPSKQQASAYLRSPLQLHARGSIDRIKQQTSCANQMLTMGDRGNSSSTYALSNGVGALHLTLQGIMHAAENRHIEALNPEMLRYNAQVLIYTLLTSRSAGDPNSRDGTLSDRQKAAIMHYLQPVFEMVSREEWDKVNNQEALNRVFASTTSLQKITNPPTTNPQGGTNLLEHALFWVLLGQHIRSSVEPTPDSQSRALAVAEFWTCQMLVSYFIPCPAAKDHLLCQREAGFDMEEEASECLKAIKDKCVLSLSANYSGLSKCAATNGAGFANTHPTLSSGCPPISAQPVEPSEALASINLMPTEQEIASSEDITTTGSKATAASKAQSGVTRKSKRNRELSVPEGSSSPPTNPSTVTDTEECCRIAMELDTASLSCDATHSQRSKKPRQSGCSSKPSAWASLRFGMGKGFGRKSTR